MVTFIHDRMKFGFIHVPKTGGMTVTNFFMNQNKDQRLLEYSPLNEHFGIHTGVLKVKRQLGERFDDYFTFAFYRNSFDWVHSLYRYIGRTTHHPMYPEVKDITFAEYVDKVAPKFLRPQKPLIAPADECLITRLEPYENFANGFQEILLELGYPAANFKSYNVSGTKDPKAYRSAYTSKMVGQVTELYQDDIRYFGFKF